MPNFYSTARSYTHLMASQAVYYVYYALSRNCDVGWQSIQCNAMKLPGGHTIANWPSIAPRIILMDRPGIEVMFHASTSEPAQSVSDRVSASFLIRSCREGHIIQTQRNTCTCLPSLVKSIRLSFPTPMTACSELLPITDQEDKKTLLADMHHNMYLH